MKHIYTLEFWKDIEGYEGLYQISNIGQVKSLISNKILKPDNRLDGYSQIKLSKDGERKNFLIHRLVAEAFLPNEEGLPEVDHINDDNSDNRVCNLQWISKVENNRKKTTGIIPRKVICLESDEVFESAAAAAKYVNRSSKSMNEHLKGRTKSCGGLHFEYFEED